MKTHTLGAGKFVGFILTRERNKTWNENNVNLQKYKSKRRYDHRFSTFRLGFASVRFEKNGFKTFFDKGDFVHCHSFLLFFFFLEQTIKESQLKQLLSHNPEEHMKAYRILEGLQDYDMTRAICDSLLTQNLHVGQTLFILQFMLTNLSSLLSPVRTEKLLCTKMGAKALLCLPVSARPNYEHLVSRPPLLLEQLLMNMKVEWAAKVFQRIQVRKEH